MAAEIVSREYCTRNEDGFPQVKIFYEHTFFQKLFGKPAIVKEYVRVPKGWVHKDSYKEVTSNEYFIVVQTQKELEKAWWV